MTFRRNLLPPCPRFPKDFSQQLTHYVGHCLLSKVYLTYRYTIFRNFFYFRLQLTGCRYIDIFLHFRINFFNTTLNTPLDQHDGTVMVFITLLTVCRMQWAHSPTPLLCEHTYYVVRLPSDISVPMDSTFIASTQKTRRLHRMAVLNEWRKDFR
jgi:hypothetical protein